MAKAIVLLVLALVAIPEAFGATTHTVGGSQGWTQGFDYSTWASGETFAVEFKYGATHTVDEVSKDDYDNCNTGSPTKTYNSGDDRIVLNSTGPMYFICPTLGHCSGGMKLAINVVAASGSTPPSTSSPPSSTTSPPGSPETPTAPPPPSTTGSNGATGVFCSKINVILGLTLVLATVGASMF
ncbi:hypothetical protein CDL15_Pgr024617 [Punica granatum]|uniref:Phytocyanin domain-containing protein n=1 Tax=Punica granatum TaxID=22663 RepID=A0A218W6I0_PUNGR|nr:hypothetical protein CDL15_Pgr024617 [Punica granatum]